MFRKFYNPRIRNIFFDEGLKYLNKSLFYDDKHDKMYSILHSLGLVNIKLENFD